MNEVYVIDHSTTTAQAATHAGGNSGKGGDFLYRWGNPATYGLSSTGNNSGFNVIHDGHWVPSTNPLYPNYMCAFNNNSGSNVKVALWNPPYNGYNYTYTAGSIVGPTAVVNPTIPSFTANDMGNSQQLDNGNELVCNPMGSIYEVSPSGTTLQTIASANSVHAYRYTMCYVRGHVASASASATDVASGTAITLSSSATSITETSPTYTYAWSSTTGFTATTQNPSVSPTASGTYSVIITNTTTGCSDTATVAINVSGSSTLSATTSATPSSVCPGSTVQLNCTPSGGTNYTYQWASSPAGFTSTQQNPTVTPTASTTYTVTVTSGTNTTTSSTAVTTYAAPTTPTITQSGSVLNSSATSGNQWYLNGSAISGQTGTSYTLTQSGSYQVLVTNGNGCTAMSTAIAVTVSGTLSVNVTSTPSSICPGSSVQLNCTPTGGTTYTYQWASTPAGFTSTSQNPTVTPTGSTTYSVTVTSGTSTGSNSTSVTLYTAPTTPTITQNGSVLNSSATSGNQWYLNGSAISGQTGTSYTPTQSGSYQVLVTNGNGCTAMSAAVAVTVSGTLSVNVTSTPSSICPGSSVQLNCTPTGGTTYTYQWASTPAGFTSTSQNPTVTPTASTTYSVTVTSGTSTGSNSTSVTLFTPPTTPVITQNGSVLNSSASTGNQWYYNGTPISGQTGSSYTPSADGSYQVMVTDANGCTAMSSTYGYSVGISENSGSNSSIKIYPNPTQNAIQLEIPSTIENYTTQIMDVCGKIIFVNENQPSIDLSSLTNGIYFIEIKVNGKSIQRNKIILNK
jgi:hypothetical protein